MNITVSKTALTRVLNIAHSIVEKRTTMPILANVLLSASEGKLKVSATNLEITAVVTTDAEVSTSGSTTVNARVFAEIVRELPAAEINLELTEGERLQITTGSSQFRMVGVSSEEFPSLPGIGIDVEHRVKANKFLEMVSKTIYAVSHDETRFNLNGVCFEHVPAEENDGTSAVRMVATDGHRLAMITRPVPGFDFESGAIVPTKGLSELRKILDDEGNKEVGIQIAEGFFVLETADAKVSMRLVDGEFPDYNQVLPKQKGTRAELLGSQLSQALRRAALMVTDRGKCVKMDFSKGKLRISSSSPELGESSEELDIKYDGEPLSVGFNAKYLLDFTGSLDEDRPVVIELNGELGPGKFLGSEDASYFGIVMPMRLG